ncbi:MAG: hypothetical protein ACRDHG_11910, partial [Anaerolineales bacterium]
IVTDIASEYSGGLSQSLKDLIQQYTAARDAPFQDNSPAMSAVILYSLFVVIESSLPSSLR